MKAGKADIIVGLDYGDEGKGRITDEKLQSGEYKIVARFNGGNNAGHTLVPQPGKKLILNSVPSGILNPEVTNYIGSGCVVDPVHLIETEFPRIKNHLDLNSNRLKISALATAITPTHILWDKISGALVGTTGRGIGPAYTDKSRRAENGVIRNLRLGDILADPKKAEGAINISYQEILHFLRQPKNLSLLQAYCQRYEISEHRQNNLVNELEEREQMSIKIAKFIDCIQQLSQQGLIEKDSLWLTKQVEHGQNVLMEGAQAFGLDISYGSTPFTTSSHTIAGSAYIGGDLSPKYHGQVFGVTKAIASRVGSGPFVGEFGKEESENYCDEKNMLNQPIFDRDFEKANYPDTDKLMQSNDPLDIGIALRIKTDEYGATTGRPRRIAMMDLHRLAAAAGLSGVDQLYITKVDCLMHYTHNRIFNGQVPLITGYQLNGESIDYIPSNRAELDQINPQLTFLPAFPDISKIRSAEALPEQVRNFVDLVQTITRTKVAGIGVGPGRDEMIHLK
jgi:adenylosuccinate synthase